MQDERIVFVGRVLCHTIQEDIGFLTLPIVDVEFGQPIKNTPIKGVGWAP